MSSRIAGPRWVIDNDAAGSRLDAFLARQEEVGSRRRASAWLDRGKVFLNGIEASRADAGRLLAAGDVVELWVDRPGTATARARGLAAARDKLRIVIEDHAVLVADKPPGLLVEPLPQPRAPAARRSSSSAAPARPACEITMLDLVADHLRRFSARSPRIVHRIDRDTSGLVVFALTAPAWIGLKWQFAKRTAVRQYFALVEGIPAPAADTWRDALAWDGRRLRQTSVGWNDPRAREAIMSYRVVERFGDVALLKVELTTGRRNQIRVQAGLRGYPLVGEKIYRFGRAPTGPAFGRQALHAALLSFLHPATGERVTVTSPLAGDMALLLERLSK